MNKKGFRSGDVVNKNKKADILQAYVEQYYRMAMDHHTKAGTVSQILLVIVTAITTLIGFDKHINGDPIDIMGSLMVLVIGGFGMLWAAKQMERYHYWEFIALGYREKLRKLIPELGDKNTYKPEDRESDKEVDHLLNPDRDNKKMLPYFIYRCQDKYLWIGLNGFIVVLGVFLTAVTLSCWICDKMCIVSL